MRAKITAFIMVSMLCSLCFDAAAYAQEPVMDEYVIEDDKSGEVTQEPGEEEEKRAGEKRTGDMAEEKQAEDMEGENVVQIQITSAGVSENADVALEEIPRSKRIRVLLVGNSLTKCAGNRTVSDLKQMAKKAKRKLSIKRITYNNEKMVNWANPRNKNGKRLYKAIRSGKWDYIVLQEQTDASVKQSFIKASKKLSAYIHEVSPNTKIIYNCTWAYKKGRKVSGKRYSFNSMQKTMNRNYRIAAEQTGGRVCRSGDAFLKYRRSKGKKKNLYRRDNNHASRYGWYLNACCLYRSIFGKSPVECKYYGGFGKGLAKKFQRIAASQM